MVGHVLCSAEFCICYGNIWEYKSMLVFDEWLDIILIVKPQWALREKTCHCCMQISAQP